MVFCLVIMAIRFGRAICWRPWVAGLYRVCEGGRFVSWHSAHLLRPLDFSGLCCGHKYLVLDSWVSLVAIVGFLFVPLYMYLYSVTVRALELHASILDYISYACCPFSGPWHFRRFCSVEHQPQKHVPCRIN